MIPEPRRTTVRAGKPKRWPFDSATSLRSSTRSSRSCGWRANVCSERRAGGRKQSGDGRWDGTHSRPGSARVGPRETCAGPPRASRVRARDGRPACSPFFSSATLPSRRRRLLPSRPRLHPLRKPRPPQPLLLPHRHQRTLRRHLPPQQPPLLPHRGRRMRRRHRATRNRRPCHRLAQAPRCSQAPTNTTDSTFV